MRPLPRQQHLSIFGNFVLLFLRGQQVIRIDVFKSDEDPFYAGARALLNKIRQAMAQRVYLNNKTDAQLLNFEVESIGRE